MNQLQFQLEMASFDEKIALAELEQAKAMERVKELIYQKNRLQMDWLRAVAKAQEQQQNQVKNAGGPQ
jgi:hypothetical protein